jgi:polygalacturonase
MSNRLTRRTLATISAAGIAAQIARSAPASSNSAGARIFDVRDHGAKGDGATLDTAAVQAAIDACAKDKGGTVLIPAGDFVVGTIELKSYVTLHIAPGGRLLGSGDPSHYSAGRGVPPGNGNVVLLYAANAENITIEGRGTIDGQGNRFYTGRGDNTGPGGNAAEGYKERPHLAIFYKCRNLAVRDVFLTRSAYHCMRVLECRDVHLDGIRIHNRVNLNNDGFHLNTNEYVNISNCNIVCQDDACALFGSNRFVTVTNCTFSTRWSIFRFGGGQAEDIAISNCVIYETYGCVIKIRCSAGSRMENISFSNLIMDKVTGPISVGLDSNYRRPPNETSPRPKGIVRNISFSGIRANVVAFGGQHADMPFKNNYRLGETRSCIVLNAVNGESLENITLSDIHVRYEGGGTAEESRREIPQTAGEYFEIGTPPAYGLYARNVRALDMRGVRFEIATPDMRPAVVFDHVADASVNSLSAQGNGAAESLLRFADTRDVLLAASRTLSGCSLFLRVEGSSNAITIDGGDISKASQAVSVGLGADPTSVKIRS